MRDLRKALLAGAMGAALIMWLFPPQPWDQSLARVRLEPVIGAEAAGEIARRPAALRSVLLDYGDDPVLLAKARIALAQYPMRTPAILILYGDTPEFRSILRRYGEAVIPVIHYFMTVEAGDDGVESGWQAVIAVGGQGHDLLGQFSVDDAGAIQRNRTEQMLEAFGWLMADGLRNLEGKLERSEALTLDDVLSVATDALMLMPAAGLLARGSLKGTRAAGQASKRSRLIGARPLPRGGGRSAAKGVARLAAARYPRLAAWGGTAAVTYLVIRHPGLLQSLLAQAGKWLGWQAWLLPLLAWTTILTVAAYALSRRR